MKATQEYLGYPLPALLFDARRGNTNSTDIILEYFANRMARGDDVPEDVRRFVGDQMRKVLEGELTPAAMFNPERKKRTLLNPLVADLVGGSSAKGDIKARCEAAGAYLHLSGNAVEKHYYQHRAYEKRLSKIQTLLSEIENHKHDLSPERFERGREIHTELIALTS